MPELTNPTVEFLENDPDIAARFGTSDSISYLMHNIADFLHVSENLITMPLMFFFNLLVTWILIYGIYYRYSRRRDYYVQFMLFSSGMFVLLWLMQILDIQTGFVLGLFAIFGITTPAPSTTRRTCRSRAASSCRSSSAAVWTPRWC